jgi:serine/threonine protein phosphatase PrpC
VFAVADGMGGHRGGEVASAAALEPLARARRSAFATPEAAMAR